MNVHWSSYNVPVNLVKFSKNSQISNFIKVRPVWEELFHADRRTDITKLIVDFRSLVSFVENGYKHSHNHTALKFHLKYSKFHSKYVNTLES